MLALVKYQKGEGNVELRQVEEPRCLAGQVKIEIAFCGVCGTDLHVMHDTFRNFPPVTLGHEFSGTIVESGTGVDRMRAGDQVAVLPASAVHCGKCSYCRMGKFIFCPSRRGMGHGVNGGFTNYVVVREDQCYHIPDGWTLEEASLCEPFSAAVQAVSELTSLRLGDIALVSGPGPIGLMCLKLLVAAGIKTLVAGPIEDTARLDAAKRIGAAGIVNVSDPNWMEQVRDYTQGELVDVAFECAGHPASVNNCLEAVRPLGRYTQVGICGQKVNIQLDAVFYKMLEVRGSVCYSEQTWHRMMRILNQGSVRLADLITTRLPLTDWKKGFDLCMDKQAVKVLITPQPQV
ncbi:MAG: alcohol dehydrogenase catalytic domain-containing protein [Acidobacteriia bacterium]|nr:alcohol dehydrogenase catalytic domain-containing protein [Terriglobia bacterium]